MVFPWTEERRESKAEFLVIMLNSSSDLRPREEDLDIMDLDLLFNLERGEGLRPLREALLRPDPLLDRDL